MLQAIQGIQSYEPPSTTSGPALLQAVSNPSSETPYFSAFLNTARSYELPDEKLARRFGQTLGVISKMLDTMTKSVGLGASRETSGGKQDEPTRGLQGAASNHPPTTTTTDKTWQSIARMLEVVAHGIVNVLDILAQSDANSCKCPAATDTTAAPGNKPTKKPSKGKGSSKTPAKGSAAPAAAGPGAPLSNSNGQFLWKPKSDKDGKLAILLPSKLTGKVSDVVVLKPDGSSSGISGKFAGVGNGEREHYRFGVAGAQFPDGSIVQIKLRDGTSLSVTIRDTSARFTK